MSKDGFSLIELMIVVALLALIVFLSGAHCAFLERMMLRAELEHLYTTCYMVQRQAMMLHQSQTITFDLATNCYHYKKTIYRLPVQLCFGTAPGVKGPPSEADHEIVTPITFPNNTITFTPYGIIQPGAIYLTNRQKEYTYGLSCAVGHVSYLRKYQYTNTWCLL